MATLKTYYYKDLTIERFVEGRGKMMVSKKPSNTAKRTIISKEEYDYLNEVIKNAPFPSDDAHEVKVRDNGDGTYDYVEVLKPIEEIVEE